MSAHSLLSPSGASRWLECPASVVRTLGMPEVIHDYTKEGVLAHAVAERYLRADTKVSTEKGTSFEGIVLTPDLIDAVNTYIDSVKLMTTYPDDIEVRTWVEMELDLSDVLNIPGEKGTSDFVALVANVLQVHDYKHGKGVPVYAENNPQLMLYAAGALAKIRALVAAGELDKSECPREIIMVIHQPRLNSTSEWAVEVKTLDAWCGTAEIKARYIKRLVDGELKISDADYNPSTKACRWCKLTATCTALEKFVTETVANDFDDLTAEVSEDQKTAAGEIGSRLGELLPRLALIAKWVGSIKEYALSFLLSGEEIPGYKLVTGKRGDRRWEDANVAEAALKAMRLKHDILYTKKLSSPTKVIAAVKKSERKLKKVVALVTRTAGGPLVVETSDKRQALVFTKPETDFDDITDDYDLTGGIDVAEGSDLT